MFGIYALRPWTPPSNRWLRFTAAWLAAWAVPMAAFAQAKLDLEVDVPQEGATVDDLAGMALVAGRALTHDGELATYDVVLAVDRSDSTRAAAGVDVDGDGRIDRRCEGVRRWLVPFAELLHRCSELHDSIFAAQLSALRTLLTQLDPRAARVGLVAFGGDGDPETPDAWKLVNLTSDYAAVRGGLDRLEAMGPDGRTNLQAGIELAARMIQDGSSKGASADTSTRKVVILVTDGVATLPAQQPMHRGSRRMTPRVHENQRQALEAANAAGQSAIQIDTYRTGGSDGSDRVVLDEIARVTGGAFAPLTTAVPLPSNLEHPAFGTIESLQIRNHTLGMEDAYRTWNPDGRFSALIPVSPGENKLEVSARTTDGSSRSLHLTVYRVEDAPALELDPRLAEMRDRVLALQLQDLRSRNLSLEMQRDEELRRELSLEMKQDGRDHQDEQRRLAIRTEASSAEKPVQHKADTQKRADRKPPQLKRGGKHSSHTAHRVHHRTGRRSARPQPCHARTARSPDAKAQRTRGCSQ